MQSPPSYPRLIKHCRAIHPDTDLTQIVLVTTGQYRVVEPAHKAGIPTALLLRPGVLESRVNVDTTAPTFLISSLTELDDCLEAQKKYSHSAVEQSLSITRRANQCAYRIAGVYQTNWTLGSAGFGTVWNAVHLLTGAEVAIKDEMQREDKRSVLPYEVQVYKLLHGIQGIPRIHWSGVYGGAHVMVMDKLGPDLECLRRFCRGRLSLKTVLMIADQVLSRIEFAHSQGIILRDVKPENCAMGMGNLRNVVHIFDFGIAKLYVNPKTGKHINMREDRIRLGPGTPRYSSANVQLQRDQSRRDDIAALGYTLLYLLHGRLPWQGIYAPSVEAKVIRIGEMKTGEAIREVLSESPAEFTTYFDHFFSLGFEENPDYELLKNIFRNRMEKEGWEYDWKFDWLDAQREGGSLIPEEYVVHQRFIRRS